MSSISFVSASWLNELFNFCVNLDNENKRFFKYSQSKKNKYHYMLLQEFIEKNYNELYLSTYDQKYRRNNFKNDNNIKLYIYALILRFRQYPNNEDFIKEMKNFIRHYYSYQIWNPYELEQYGERYEYQIFMIG